MRRRTAPPEYRYETLSLTIGGGAAQYLVPAQKNGRVILYIHGSSETETAPLDDVLKADLIRSCIRSGYIIASHVAAGNAWGNQASLTAYAALSDDIVTRFGSPGVLLLAQSMGGLSCLNGLIAGNFDNVEGAALIYPACNLANMYAGELQPIIAVAYNIPGGGDYATQTSGFDPALRNAAEFPDIPYRFYASPGDTLVTKADNTDVIAAKLAAKVNEHAVVVCSGNHGDASHFQSEDLKSFYSRC